MASDGGQKDLMWRVSERVAGLVQRARAALQERDGVDWSQTKTIEVLIRQGAKAMGIVEEAAPQGFAEKGSPTE